MERMSVNMIRAVAIASAVLVLPSSAVWTPTNLAPCTSRPALLRDWRDSTPWPTASDSVLREKLAPYRNRVSFDPFDSVIVGDAATRARLNEGVLWEDDSVIVIVAKPPLPRDALVVPKREMMFPVDASPWLMDKLSRVAAATSDAFIATAGRACSRALVSKISINPPDIIRVRHLHVHVQPPDSIAITGENEFYARMSQRLREALSIRP